MEFCQSPALDSVLTDVERSSVKDQHLTGFSFNKDVDVDVRPVGAVAAFEEIDGVVRLVAGTDVQSKLETVHSIQTAVHHELSHRTITNEVK